MKTLWEKHEHDVQQLLDLDSTVASGNKSYDPGDGVSRKHYTEQDFRLYAECKLTEQKSYSLKREDIAAYALRAREYGKTFCLPVRFQDGSCYTDYIVLRLLDFSDILSRAERSADERASAIYLTKIVDCIKDTQIRSDAKKHLKNILGE